MKNNRCHFGRQCISDIRVGVSSKKVYLIASAIISFVFSNGLFGRLYASQSVQIEDIKVSVGDCFIYLFRGVDEYRLENRQPFDVSFQYMVLGILLILIIGNYAVSDMHGYGRFKLVLSQSKLKWWISKCIWCLTAVLSYVGALFTGVVVSGIIHYKYMDFTSVRNLFGVHSEIVLKYVKTNTALEQQRCIEEVSFVLGAVIMIVAALYAFSMIQMALSLIVNPAVSAIAIIAIYIFSAFYMRNYMIGNYVMLCRSDIFLLNGVDFTYALITSVLISAMSFVLGYMTFRKRDII